MILDPNGQPTSTNAPRRDTGCIEVVMASPAVIEGFEEWLTGRGLYLFPIPLGEASDHLPAYGIGFRTPPSERRSRPGQDGGAS